MNVVVVISILVGFSAAGFVWFGWDLLEAFLNRSSTAASKAPSKEAPDKE